MCGPAMDAVESLAQLEAKNAEARTSKLLDVLRNLLLAFHELGTSFATHEQQDALRAAREAVKCTVMW